MAASPYLSLHRSPLLSPPPSSTAAVRLPTGSSGYERLDAVGTPIRFYGCKWTGSITDSRVNRSNRPIRSSFQNTELSNNVLSSNARQSTEPKMSHLKPRLSQDYFLLKGQLLEDSAFEFTDESLLWLDTMLDYNVPRGKLNRAMSVIECYKLLKEGKAITDHELYLASALGWSIEWIQAYVLILDDIMDNSLSRRGQPCWFRLPEVGMVAVNDATILRNQAIRILKNHFKEKSYYVDMLDLFNEVELQTVYGQLIDLLATQGEEKLSNCSLDLFYRISKYKGACFFVYLPVACALLLAGENLENHHDIKNILVEIAALYQIQDDYLDCFGDPKITGKVGTDIEEGKCSWLVVKALELANEDQKKLLNENYGKTDPACVAKVKELYELLGLQGVYKASKEKIIEKLTASVAAHPSKVVKAVWQRYTATINSPSNKS